MFITQALMGASPKKYRIGVYNHGLIMSWKPLFHFLYCLWLAGVITGLTLKRVTNFA